MSVGFVLQQEVSEAATFQQTVIYLNGVTLCANNSSKSILLKRLNCQFWQHGIGLPGPPPLTTGQSMMAQVSLALPPGAGHRGRKAHVVLWGWMGPQELHPYKQIHCPGPTY